MINALTDIVWVIVIYIVIAVLWQVAEKLMYGQITPRIIDDVVALVLAVSLYINIKN